MGILRIPPPGGARQDRIDENADLYFAVRTRLPPDICICVRGVIAGFDVFRELVTPLKSVRADRKILKCLEVALGDSIAIIATSPG